MTLDEARPLLSLYADGLLEPQQAQELEAVLAREPELQQELKLLQEENALLTEALAPLNPSRTMRVRLSEMMVEVQRRAEAVAERIPEQGWRLFKMCFAALALGAAILLGIMYPRPRYISDGDPMFYAAIGIFVVGVAFMLGAPILAKYEAGAVALLSKKRFEATRLEVLILEVFGLFCVVAALVLYLYTVWPMPE